jgi:hypothetical protein
MVLAQSIIGTSFKSTSAGNPVAGTYIFDGLTYSFTNGFGTSYTYPKLSLYRFPNESQTNVIQFNGLSGETTYGMGTLNNFYLNLWVYPTSFDRAILTELESPPSPGYYYNMLEVNSSGYIKAGTWNGGTISSVTSTNKVILNAWNHIYFYFDSGTLHLEVNGGTAATATSITRSGPTNSFFAFGFSSATNMGSQLEYQGYVDAVEIYSSSHGSSYSTTKAKYQAQQVLALYANTYTSNGTWTDTISSKAFTIYNNPTYSVTNGGQIRFNAANSEYGDTGTGNSLSSLSSYTIQGVFQVQTASQAGAPCLITEGWPGSSKINYAIGYINGSDQIDAGFFDGTSGYWNVLSAKSSPSTNTWYDVVCTFYGPTKELRVYLDGTLVSNTTAPGTAASENLGIKIARRWDNPNYLDGTIKDISIWSGVMTPSEVADRHTPYTSLV